MPFTHEQYARLRPYLYHLTAAQNIDRIRATGHLDSTSNLLRASGLCELVGVRRKSSRRIMIGGATVVLRDQMPLTQANITFTHGWAMEDFVNDLNGRVFFWSGWESRPIAYGLRHYRRYLSEGPTVIRVNFQSLIDCNPGRDPLFCKYNSGSPRCNAGKRSPRGSQTFLNAGQCPYNISDVVEVTFIDRVFLPTDTDYSFAMLDR